MKVLLSLMLFCGSANALTYYVDINGSNPTAPYTNWTIAATSIQDACDQADSDDGGTIIVSDGVYAIFRAYSDTEIISVNGPETTIIDGGGTNYTCAYLSGNNGALSGFTLQNGTGGISANSSSVISNCIVRDNNGAGGISGGTIYDSVITNNYSTYRGGGISGGAATNCVISGNIADEGGGGLYQGVAVDCVIEGNTALYGSGGGASYSGLSRCIVENNSAWEYGGGLFGNDYPGTENCVFVNNFALLGGGAMAGSGAKNCTFIDNDSLSANARVIWTRDYSSLTVPPIEVANCVLVQSEDMTQIEMAGDQIPVYFSCSPALTHGTFGNITNDPQFVVGYRLPETSPCVDTGWNIKASSTLDKDMNPRIVNGTVDMGAYERQTPESAVNLPVRMVVESSTDLHSWTNTGRSMEMLMPANNSNEFYRVRLETLY